MKANPVTSYLGSGMLALSATLGQAWMVSTAHAADAPVTYTRRVNVSDLDLSKSTDVATLYARITSAAQQVCRSDRFTDSILPNYSKTQCTAEAVYGAVSQINNASLWAYHKHEATKISA